MLVTNSGKIGLQILVTCTRPLGNPVDGVRIQAMSSAPHYACQAPGLALDGFWPSASGLETLLSLGCPRSRLFPLPLSRTWLLPSSLEWGEHLAFGGLGWQEVKEQLRAAVFRLQGLVLPWGFIGAKKGGGKGFRAQCCRPCVFLEKITTQTTVCIVIPTPGGGNSLKWGTGVSRGQAGGELHTALCTVLSSPSPKSWVSCVWVGLLGRCVGFFCHFDEGCSAR